MCLWWNSTHSLYNRPHWTNKCMPRFHNSHFLISWFWSYETHECRVLVWTASTPGLSWPINWSNIGLQPVHSWDYDSSQSWKCEANRANILHWVIYLPQWSLIYLLLDILPRRRPGQGLSGQLSRVQGYGPGSEKKGFPKQARTRPPIFASDCHKRLDIFVRNLRIKKEDWVTWNHPGPKKARREEWQ